MENQSNTILFYFYCASPVSNFIEFHQVVLEMIHTNKYEHSVSYSFCILCSGNTCNVKTLGKWCYKYSQKVFSCSLQSGILNSSSSGNQRTFSALWHASRLPFRATASKTIVLLQCTLCQETEDEYSNMISMLLENDITLHMLQPLSLRMHSGQGKASKVYGVDLHGAFSGHNLKSLMPSLPLLRQVI